MAAWAPTSHASRRVRGEQHLGVVRHLAADDELLLVAAGQGPPVTKIDGVRTS
jgi:hypothetical protein